MAAAACTDAEFIQLWKKFGNPTKVAEHLGISVRTVHARRNRIARAHDVELKTSNPMTGINTRYVKPNDGVRALADVSGYVVVFSDAHFFPGEYSLGLQAMLRVIKDLKPKLVIANGDILDGATIHGHGPQGWERPPTLKEELDAVQDCMSKIQKAAKGAILMRTTGNHDIRFDRRMAMGAPEYRGISGSALKDHLPHWEVSWSIMVNGNTMIKHRINGGVHSAYNNTLKGGINIVTGHTHLLEVKPWTDYTGRRYGVSTGMLADPMDAQFRYAEDNPRPWCQGFAVLKYDEDGMLMPPELCEVINGRAYFRGGVVV